MDIATVAACTAGVAANVGMFWWEGNELEVNLDKYTHMGLTNPTKS